MFRIGSLVLLAAACLSACSAPSTALPGRSYAALTTLSTQRTAAAQQFLYAINRQGAIVSYALPMVSGESPAVTTATYPSGIAVQGDYLFASTDRANRLSELKLPLTSGERPSVSLDVQNAGPIAAGTGFVYIVVNGVASYATPLKSGELPTATTTVQADITGPLAVDSSHLYVVAGSSGGTVNTVSSYALPLQNAEASDATTAAPPQETYLSGITVRGKFLYVSRYNSSEVVAYKLPLTNGEKPSVTLHALFGSGWTGALAATSTDIYVSDAAVEAWDFTLPLHSGEKSTTGVSTTQFTGNTLAVQP